MFEKSNGWRNVCIDPDDPMWECPDCHEILTLPPFTAPKDIRFEYCPFCGRRRQYDGEIRPWVQLTDYEIEEAQANFKCPDCGGVIGCSYDAKLYYGFCPLCGNRRYEDGQ